MRHFFTLSVIALAALLGACSTNPTTPATTGEIYGQIGLTNEYSISLVDNSGITCQLIENGTVIQTVITASDGMYSFKNVQAGVYDFQFFKHGYTTAPYSYTGADTVFNKNQQFVGRGKFRMFGIIGLYSIVEPDSTYWTFKPDIRYEVIKDIQQVDKVFLKDTVIKRKNPDSTNHYDSEYITLYGSGTSETRKIRCTIDFDRALPYPTMKRTVVINNVTLTVAATELSTVYEFTSPNKIVKDSLGKLITHSRDGTVSTEIRQQTILLQATSVIPKGLRNWNDPQKISKTNELKLSLTD